MAQFSCSKMRPFLPSRCRQLVSSRRHDLARFRIGFSTLLQCSDIALFLHKFQCVGKSTPTCVLSCCLVCGLSARGRSTSAARVRGWRFGSDACGAGATYTCCAVATVGNLFELHCCSQQLMFCTTSFLFSKFTTHTTA